MGLPWRAYCKDMGWLCEAHSNHSLHSAGQPSLASNEQKLAGSCHVKLHKRLQPGHWSFLASAQSNSHTPLSHTSPALRAQCAEPLVMSRSVKRAGLDTGIAQQLIEAGCSTCGSVLALRESDLQSLCPTLSLQAAAAVTSTVAAAVCPSTSTVSFARVSFED